MVEEKKEKDDLDKIIEAEGIESKEEKESETIDISKEDMDFDYEAPEASGQAEEAPPADEAVEEMKEEPEEKDEAYRGPSTEEEALEELKKWEIYESLSDEGKEKFDLTVDSISALETYKMFFDKYKDEEDMDKKVIIFYKTHEKDYFENISLEDVENDFGTVAKTYSKYPETYDYLFEAEEDEEVGKEEEGEEEEDSELKKIKADLKRLGSDMYKVGDVKGKDGEMKGGINVDMANLDQYDGTKTDSDEEGFDYLPIKVEVLEELYDVGFIQQAETLLQEAGDNKRIVGNEERKTVSDYIGENVSEEASKLWNSLLKGKYGKGRVMGNYLGLIRGIGEISDEHYFKHVKKNIRKEIRKILNSVEGKREFHMITEDGKTLVFDYEKDIKEDINFLLNIKEYDELYNDLEDSIAKYRIMIKETKKYSPFWFGNERKMDDAKEIKKVYEKILPLVEKLKKGKAEFPRQPVKTIVYNTHLAEALTGAGINKLKEQIEDLKEGLENPSLFVIKYKFGRDEDGDITSIKACKLYMIDENKEETYVDLVKECNEYAESKGGKKWGKIFQKRWGMLEDAIYSLARVKKGIKDVGERPQYKPE
ncbi:MAG: hypothetical protein ACE5J7_02245 [Candidatus Aenigmatarchaeota archaeon]